jgi:prevent-host-death family protein
MAAKTPMQTCGAEQARATLPELLDQAHQGRVTVITRHGRPYAALVPADRAQSRARRLPLLSLRGSGVGLWGDDSRGLISRMRDEWV